MATVTRSRHDLTGLTPQQIRQRIRARPVAPANGWPGTWLYTGQLGSGAASLGL